RAVGKHDGVPSEPARRGQEEVRRAGSQSEKIQGGSLRGPSEPSGNQCSNSGRCSESVVKHTTIAGCGETTEALSGIAPAAIPIGASKHGSYRYKVGQ